MIATNNYLTLNNVFNWFKKNVNSIKVTKLMLKKLCEEDKIKYFMLGNRCMISLDSCLSFFDVTGNIENGNNN